MIEIKCIICGKIFEVLPYRKDTAKYCSYKCMGVGQTGLKLHTKIPDLTKNCVNCNKNFKRTCNTSYKEWETRKFCSRKCMEEYMVGENASFYNKHHTEESKKKTSLKTKGISPPIKNKTYIEAYGEEKATEIKKKQSESGKNRIVTKETCEKMSKTKREKSSLELRIKNSLGHSGEKEFTGFKKELSCRIWNMFEYKDWRKEIFERDKFTCQMCGDSTGGNLNAHHIEFLNRLIKKNNIKTIEDAKNCACLWDIDNGITFCKDCHKLYHKYFPK